MLNSELVKIVSDYTNARPYENRSCSPKAYAQDQLSGRTHYVDESTLKYFNARISLARPVALGLFFLICESVTTPEGGRGFRFVLFDVFGTVIFHPNLDQLKNTSEKAKKYFYQWFDQLDVTAHYLRALQSKLNATIIEKMQYENALKLLNADSVTDER